MGMKTNPDGTVTYVWRNSKARELIGKYPSVKSRTSSEIHILEAREEFERLKREVQQQLEQAESDQRVETLRHGLAADQEHSFRFYATQLYEGDYKSVHPDRRGFLIKVVERMEECFGGDIDVREFTYDTRIRYREWVKEITRVRPVRAGKGAMQIRPATNASIDVDFDVMNVVLKLAINAGVIKQIPPRPKKTKQRRREVVLYEHEVAAIAAAIPEAHDRPNRADPTLDFIAQQLLWFEFHSGCRGIEAVNITWSNIDWNKDGREDGGGIYVPDTKDGTSHWVEMYPEVEAVLRNCLPLKKKGLPGPFFIKSGTYRARVRKARELAWERGDLPRIQQHQLRDCTPHCLRHSAITHLANTEGADVYSVMAFANHKSIATSQRYFHRTAETSRKLRNLKRSQANAPLHLGALHPES